MYLKKQFIPYELALELKELGFDEECFRHYTEDNKMLLGSANTKYYTLAPLYQQVFDFFRNKYNIHTSFKPVFGEKNYNKYKCNIYVNERIVQVMKYEFPDNPYFDSYEEARLECLKKLIEIVNKK